jgi:hypothetical protein
MKRDADFYKLFCYIGYFCRGLFHHRKLPPKHFFQFENVGLENSKKLDFEIRKNRISKFEKLGFQNLKKSDLEIRKNLISTFEKNHISKFEKNVWATLLVGKGFSTEMAFVAK